MSDRTPTRRVAYKDLAFDPLLSDPESRFAGLYVRAAADVFRFVPMPLRAVPPEIAEPPPHAPAPAPIQALGAGDWQHGLHVKFEDEGQSQELSLPVLGNQHDVRFACTQRFRYFRNL